MSKKTVWYSTVSPLIIVLAVLTIVLNFSGQADPVTLVIVVAAVSVGTILGAITVAWYNKRKIGS